MYIYIEWHTPVRIIPESSHRQEGGKEKFNKASSL